MIDQDGVVLDEKYQLTADISEISERIKKDKNVLLIPNSDTPVKRLAKNFELIFGFKPAIAIGEKGAVISVGDRKMCPIKIRGINNYRKKLASFFKKGGAEVEIGDSATWIRMNKKFKPNSRMIIIDAFREQTIGFYLKKTDVSGKTYTDKEWLIEGMKIVKNDKLPAGLENFNFNPSYGIAVANAKGFSKKDGAKIIKKLYPDAEFYMIGDSDNDYLGGMVVHCAVSNASDKFKRKSKFIAKNSYTTGMKECLEWILK